MCRRGGLICFPIPLVPIVILVVPSVLGSKLFKCSRKICWVGGYMVNKEGVEKLSIFLVVLSVILAFTSVVGSEPTEWGSKSTHPS